MTATNPSSKPSADSATASAPEPTTRRPRPRSLAGVLVFRQALLLTLLLLVIGLSQYVVLRTVLYRSSAASLRNELSVLTPLIHRSLEEQGASASTFPALAGLLINRLHAPGVEVVVANRYGMVVASSPTLPPQLPPVAITDYTLWQQRVVVTEPVGRRGQPPLGYVWLLTSDRPIATVLDRDMELYGFLGVLALVATVGVGSLAIRRSLAPLGHIIEGTVSIAKGNYGHTTDVRDAPEELRALGDAVNHMSEAVATAFAKERAAQEEVRRFLADASHELRTPLTAITGFLSLMASGSLTPAETQQGIEAMRQESQRMQRILNQLTTLSRLDTAPASQVIPVRLNLQDWVNRMRPTWTSLYPDRQLDVSADPLTVLADPDRLQEILLNLLDNASRYTPPGSPVSVTVQARQGYGEITVADRGPGIRPEDLPHIFDRFYRGGRGRARSSGGSGLGLAIVKALVEAQGGQVSAANREDGGALFRVRLPLADPIAPAASG